MAAVTGQAALATVAEQAFSYERSLFDPWGAELARLRAILEAQRAVPSRRMLSRGATAPPGSPSHDSERTSSPRFQILKHEAEIALETTRVHTEAVLRAGGGSILVVPRASRECRDSGAGISNPRRVGHKVAVTSP